MAKLSPLERARVWNSLDDNVREQIRSGQLSIEEAAELVVPIGDLALARAREEGPGRAFGAIEYDNQAPTPPSLDVPVEQAQGLDRVGATFRGARDVYAGSWFSKFTNYELSELRGLMSMTPELQEQMLAEADKIESTPEINPRFRTNLFAARDLRQRVADAREIQSDPEAQVRLTELMAARRNEQDLIQKGYAAIDANADPARLTRAAVGVVSQPEQALPLAASAAGSLLGPAVGAAAGAVTAAIPARVAYDSAYNEAMDAGLSDAEATGFAKWMATSEYALEAIPAGRLSGGAVKNLLGEWLKRTGKLGAREAVTEAGTGVIQDAGNLVISRTGSEAVAEYAASQLPDSVGEFAQRRYDEALGGFMGGAALTAPSTAAQTRADKDQQEIDATLRQQEFDEAIRQLEEEAGASRFNAEREAERAARDIKDAEALARGEQLELPIGSGYGGSVLPTNVDGTPTPGFADLVNEGRRIPGNDRTPTIRDMFSGEEQAATKAEQRRAANQQEAAALADGRPSLTQEEFDTRSEREFKAREQVEARKQDAFEQTKQAEETTRRRLAEAQTTLKQEKQLLSTADITREAKRLLEVEKEGVRVQRAGIAKTPNQMITMLRAYERKRLPELVENVRNRRLQAVNEARDLVIAEENSREAPTPSLNEARDQFARQPRGFSTTPTATSPGFRVENLGAPMTDLLPERQEGAASRVTSPSVEMDSATPAGTQGQLELAVEETQPGLFGPQATGFTGTLTEGQAQEEARRLVERRRPIVVERAKRAQETKQQAEAEEAQTLAAASQEAGLVANALAKEQSRRATVTQKAYAKKEQDAMRKFVKEELDARGTRSQEELTKAITNKMLAWRVENPRPANVPAPATESPATVIQERAGVVASRIEGQKKSKDTRTVDKRLAKEIKAGATPTEAAETVAKQVLSREEDAALRERLASRSKQLPDKPALFYGETTDSEAIRKNNAKTLKENPEYYMMSREEIEKDTPSLDKVLEYISKDSKQSKGYRNIANQLRPIMTALNVKLRPGFEGMTQAGMYRPSTNTIYINALQPETMLHEALHAALSTAIGRPGNFPEAMRPKLRKLTSELEDTRLALIDALNTPTITRSGGITAAGIGNKLAQGNGPLSNVDELISYFMLNPDLQFLADQVGSPVKQTGTISSLIRKVYDAICDFFGLVTVTDKSALRQIIVNTSELLREVGSNPQATRQAMLQSGIDLEQATPEVAIDTGGPKPGKRTFTAKGLLRPEWKNTIGEAIADTLTAGGGRVNFSKGTKSSIVEAIERSASETGAYISRAEQLFKTMDSGLEIQAIRSGKNVDEYRKEFSTDVEALEQETDRTAKANKARSLRKKYGNVAKAYFKSRRTIDSLSNEILQQRLADPKPFTQEEAQVYTSIKENLGKYYTRAYAANTRNIGEKRAKKIWKEFEEVAKGSKNPDYRDGYEIVAKAIKYVSDHQLLIPEDLETLNLVELTDLAKAWGVLPTGEADLANPLDLEQRRDAIIEGLENLRQASPETRMSQARGLVEGLLFARKNSALVNYYRGSETDRTIVEKRKFVPKEIRELLGEYEDLPLKAMTSIIRMAAFRSKTKAFNEVLSRQLGNTVLTPEQFRERDLSTQDWQQLSGKGVGPLEGMYVRKDVAAGLESTLEITRTFDQLLASGERGAADRVKHAVGAGLESWMKFAGLVKSTQLVWNTSNAMFNWGGGGITAVGNGNVNVAAIAKAHKIAGQLVASQTSDITSKDMEKVIRAGITDSALLGTIRKVEADKLDEVLFRSLRGPLEKRGRRLLTAGGNVGRTWRETYAMADVVWKIANFLNEEERLTKYYKAAGMDVSPEAIEREAAWRTNLSNFSYKRVPNLIKDIEKGGLSFVLPYVYETFRAQAGSFAIGVMDIVRAMSAPTPEARNLALRSGAARLLGSTLAIGILQQTLYAAMHMADRMLFGADEEEEEWVEKLKVALPDYKKYADFAYLGRNTEGEPVLLEMSRLDPFGPASEFYRMAAGGASPEEYLETAKNLLVVNPYGTGILQAFLGKGSTNTRMEDSFPVMYEAIVGGASAAGLDGKRVARAVDRILPSAMVRPFDINNLPAKDDPFSWTLRAMGTQLHNVDVPRAIEFAAMEYDTEQSALRDQFLQKLQKTRDLSENELLSTLSDMYEDEQAAMDDLTEFYTGLQELGYTPREIVPKLKAAGLTDHELVVMMTGYSPMVNSIVSESSVLRSLTELNDRAVPEARKEKFKNNVRTLVQLVKEGKVSMKE